MGPGSRSMRQAWSVCAIVLAIFALDSTAQSSKYNVGFENPSYNVGDSYTRANQQSDWSVLWSQGMDGANAVISTNAKSSGERSLKIGYPPSVQDPKQAMWALSGAKTYYLRYRVLFAENFEFNGRKRQETGTDQLNGGKLPGLAGRPSDSSSTPCGGCVPCSPGSGFTARLMWRTDGVGELYLYDSVKQSEGFPCGKSYVFTGNKKFRRGAWQTLIQKVSLNDPGQSNGRIQVWLDGQQVVNVSNRKIVGKGEDIDAVFFSTAFGGNTKDWFPTKQETAFFDSFVVSQNAADVGL